MTVRYVPERLFDGVDGQVRACRALVVDGERVVAVGPAAELAADETVELPGTTIVPGFVDAHTHVTLRPGEGNQDGQAEAAAVWQTIRGVRNLGRMLAAGVTTARIMTEEHLIDVEFRDAVARGEVAGPRLLVSGAGLSPPGGHGCTGPGVAGAPALRAAVRDRAAQGADHIKIFTTGGVSSTHTSLGDSQYSAEEIAAIVGEARLHGLTVAAHAHGGAGVRLAVENGIHSIEHGAMLTDEDIAVMRQHHTWLVFTTTILFHPEGIEQGDGAVPEIMAKVRAARASASDVARRVRAAGLRIAVGTDSMHGLFGYEIRWLVEHGWTVEQALTAATRSGAEVIGQDDTGVLRPGSRADFVVLGGDPTVDIAAVHDVRAVHKGGRRVV
jgi:imidazolonepropionase-like amidohydrolase